MLALMLMESPTTVQSPVPTSRAPVTNTDVVNIIDKDGLKATSSFTTASVLILPDPLW